MPYSNEAVERFIRKLLTGGHRYLYYKGTPLQEGSQIQEPLTLRGYATITISLLPT
jgi:hypothetical protein